MFQIHALALSFSRAYLIETDSNLFLVDAGAPGDAGRILKLCHSLAPKELQLIFITHAHPDHFGAAAALRRRTGALIAVQIDDAEALEAGGASVAGGKPFGRLVRGVLGPFERRLRAEPTPANLLLADSANLEGFGLQARILHTPGHTPGSSCLLTSQGQAFVGDLVTMFVRPYLQALLGRDWKQIRQSLKKLAAHDPQQIYRAHGRRVLEPKDLRRLMRRIK